jgi:hypothetical protein
MLTLVSSILPSTGRNFPISKMRQIQLRGLPLQVHYQQRPADGQGAARHSTMETRVHIVVSACANRGKLIRVRKGRQPIATGLHFALCFSGRYTK